MKIISLVPSITETLFDFGLNSSEIVGRTKFCIHPKNEVKEVAIIGGTKNLNLEKIKALQPDLIIANKEENEKKQILELQKEFNVWITDIATLEDNENFLLELGKILDKEKMASAFIEKINQVFGNLPKIQPRKTAYLIWKNPYLSVGSNTFIHSILTDLGFENLLKNQTRYPEITVEQIQKAELIFLSSEPFPFREKHRKEFQKLTPNSKIILVDGEAFSWYGTHLAKREAYYQNLLSEID